MRQARILRNGLELMRFRGIRYPYMALVGYAGHICLSRVFNIIHIKTALSIPHFYTSTNTQIATKEKLLWYGVGKTSKEAYLETNSQTRNTGSMCRHPCTSQSSQSST